MGRSRIGGGEEETRRYGERIKDEKKIRGERRCERIRAERSERKRRG